MPSSWQSFAPSAHAFTAPLSALFDDDDVRILLDGAPFSRRRADGLLLLDGRVKGRRAGVAIFDFRVNGGSLGKENSERFGAFLREMAAECIPVFIRFDTIGVRFTEGRTVFGRTFELVVTLSELAEKSLLVTSVDGQCLGLGAVLFGLGHYRIGVANKVVNLTGPEVFRMFFKEDVDFETTASVERQQENTTLVHDVVPSTEALLERVRLLLALSGGPATTGPLSTALEPRDARIEALLTAVGTDWTEVFHNAQGSVRAFMGRRAARAVGVLMNPPGRVGNMIRARDLLKYEAALDLFRAMHVPVISFLDTPGVDPRPEEANRDVVRLLVRVAQRIANYPHPRLGVLIGRCFGGAAILSFPKNVVSTVNANAATSTMLAFRGARVGIMDPRIIDRLLSGSVRLSREWKAVSATQPDDLSDLIEAGLIDRVIDPIDLSEAVASFLAAHGPARD